MRMLTWERNRVVRMEIHYNSLSVNRRLLPPQPLQFQDPHSTQLLTWTLEPVGTLYLTLDQYTARKVTFRKFSKNSSPGSHKTVTRLRYSSKHTGGY